MGKVQSAEMDRGDKFKVVVESKCTDFRLLRRVARRGE